MIQRSLRTLVISFLTLGTLGACNSYVDNGLVGDAMNDSFCPPGCVAESKPSAESLFVRLENLGSIAGKAGGKVEVTGACRTLYSNSTITFKAYIPGVSNRQLAAVDVLKTTGNASGVVSCYNGRFHAMISLLGVTAGNYTLEAQIYSLDTNGGAVQNTAQGISRTSLAVSN